MKRSLSLIFMLLVCSMAAWANGGPTYVYSSLTLSRAPVMRHVPEVKLVHEDVRFMPQGDVTEVRVRYVLHNRSDRDFKGLPYGFPIDYYSYGDEQWHMAGMVDTDRELGWRDRYVRDVHFRLGGKELEWRCSKDTLLRAGKRSATSTMSEDEQYEAMDRDWDEAREAGMDVYEYQNDLKRRWFYTGLDLPAGKVVELEVRYKVQNTVGDYLEGGLDSRLWDVWFEYDFSPAAYWGDGIAGSFALTLVPEAPKPKYFKYDWLEMTPIDGGWHYGAQHFDLAKARPFKLNYQLRSPDMEIGEVLAKRIPPTDYTIKLSGVDPKYPQQNLSDLDLSTTTVLRPDKEGRYFITIKLKRPVERASVLIYNGYTKDARSWENNSHIDGMTYGHGGYYLLSKYDSVRAPKSFDFQECTRVAIKHAAFYHYTVVLEDGTREETNVNEATYEINDIAKGKKYDDLCIPEIIVFEYNPYSGKE